MDDTPNLNLPYIMAAQAQKHVTHNEAIRALDAVVQIGVADRSLSAPPASPTEGARYIVAAGATGAWSGKEGEVAAWQDGAWMFYAPREGWLAWVADEDALVAWDGAGWIAAGAGGAGAFTDLSDTPAAYTGAAGKIVVVKSDETALEFAVGVPLLGVNATPDATNRLAIASVASLFDHAGAGHQHKINKNAAGDTASLLFQTGFSGRAEFGTTGDDDWHVKVSPDGSTWHEALVVDKDTGHAGFGTGNPLAPVHVSVSDAAASAVTRALLLTHVTTGTPGAGIGVGLGFEVETSAANNEVVAAIEASVEVATPGAEAGALIFKTMSAGAAAAERARVGAGGLDVAGSLAVTSSVRAPTLVGGTGTGSALTLKSTSGAGATDAIVFQVGNNGATEAFRVNTSGDLQVGSATTLTGALADAKVQITGVGDTDWGQVQGSFSNDALGLGLVFAKSRNTTVNSHTIVQNDDELGGLFFYGSDGTQFIEGAYIDVHVNGTPGVNDMPTRMAFAVTPDGSAAAVESCRIVQGGQFLKGHTAAVAVGATGAVIPAIQQHGATASPASFANYNWVNGTGGPVNYLAKSRSGTIGTRGIVSSGDSLGSLNFQGDDGTNFVPGASIAAASDGTPGTNDMPGRLMFSTTADGASATTERMRIANGGNIYCIGAGTTASAANAFLDSGSTPANELLRSTSSLRYKRGVEDMGAEHAEAILKLRPVYYRSRCARDREDWSHWGFIAEEVAQVDRRFVHYGYQEDAWEELVVEGELVRRLKPDAEKVPDGVAYERLTVPILHLVRRLWERNEAFAEELADMRRQLR